MNERVKNSVSWWILKEHNLQYPHNAGKDVFIAFFIYYMCLDAMLTAESGIDSDSGRLKWLIRTKNELRQAFEDDALDKSSLSELKRLSPVYDMRPGHLTESVALNDIGNFKEVVDFIYQIRCNFFHGGKSLQENRDIEIVTYAGKFLEKWIKYLVPCGIR
ncbi:MAG: hypothetical protein KJ760_20285 [Proteobacteria bacterium]|nr:hypothetical protein [Pseudomonadota bacterium]MBU2572752.1 hypothetical protein [Elusimicrobiota bacterium]